MMWSADYQNSVEGLRSAAPDLSSTPSKGVLVKKKKSALASRVATPGASKKDKHAATSGETLHNAHQAAAPSAKHVALLAS
jgi:hypothetical protein